MIKNTLLMTDVYKMGHMEQYAPGVNKVYAYLMARNDREFKEMVFFGLKYYLMEYLSKPILPEHGDEFLEYRRRILGSNSPQVESKIRALCKLGYWPLKIKTVKEGAIYPVKNAILTITNTLPEFYWCVGFVESLLLKIWYPCTVSTHVMHYRRIVEDYYRWTCSADNMALKDFAVHDFGYRGDSSEESAMLSGGAHLLHFKGSDTVVAYPFMEKYYPELKATMFSVPASEPSVMCSFGREDEIGAYKHMLKTYPEGIVSIVSDTYNLWEVLTHHTKELYSEIVNRAGKVVFRPDSGDPIKIICGDPDAVPDSPEYLGCLRLLENMFGSTVNEKGYKELNPKVGLIYGDGMYLQRYEAMLARMKEMGWAASNLIIGVGSLLRSHTRDTLGFALKATYVEIDGKAREIMKDPITDHKKKSHQGLLQLKAITESIGSDQGISETHSARRVGYETVEHCTWEQERNGLLKTVFINGKLFEESHE